MTRPLPVGLLLFSAETKVDLVETIVVLQTFPSSVFMLCVCVSYAVKELVSGATIGPKTSNDAFRSKIIMREKNGMPRITCFYWLFIIISTVLFPVWYSIVIIVVQPSSGTHIAVCRYNHVIRQRKNKINRVRRGKKNHPLIWYQAFSFFFLWLLVFPHYCVCTVSIYIYFIFPTLWYSSPERKENDWGQGRGNAFLKWNGRKRISNSRKI